MVTWLKLTLVLLQMLHLTAGCIIGWFGPKCQYKCYCANNLCDIYGWCNNTSVCVLGWFGPACQYEDLNQVGSLTTSPATSSTTLLTDGNDLTCLNGTAINTLTVDWIRPYHFTWMRFHIQEPDSLKNVTVQFQERSNSSELVNCSQYSISTSPNRTIQDIHCLINVTVQRVILTGTFATSLCSFFISGGRNVALKQNTTQSSTFLTYTSDKAVEGDKRAQFRNINTCTHTNENDPAPTWSLMFAHPQIVDRYVIYNRAECCMDRLTGFSVTCFSEEDNVVFNYTDTEQTLLIYSITPSTGNRTVSHVQISAARKIPLQRLFLTLCEVEIYGDSVCEFGKHGRECEYNCSCARNETCFVSTGSCPSGCAKGFYGLGCLEECTETVYGFDCKESCANNCSNRSCDSTTGHCFSCIPGTAGQFCDEECPATFYGVNCEERCSNKCSQQKCDSISGHCFSCISGAAGPFCDQVCNHTEYGPGCKLTCSQFCKMEPEGNLSSCHHVSGACLLGCADGYQGHRCDVQETSDKLTIGVTIGVLLIVATAAGVGIYYYRRRRSRMPRDALQVGEHVDNIYISQNQGSSVLNQESDVYVTPVDGNYDHYNISDCGNATNMYEEIDMSVK